MNRKIRGNLTSMLRSVGNFFRNSRRKKKKRQGTAITGGGCKRAVLLDL